MYFSLSGSVVRLMNTWLSFFLVSGKHVQEKVKVGLRVFYERGRCITQTSWTCWFVSFFSFLLFSFSFFIFYSHLPPCSFWLFSFRVSFFRFLVFPLFLFCYSLSSPHSVFFFIIVLLRLPFSPSSFLFSFFYFLLFLLFLLVLFPLLFPLFSFSHLLLFLFLFLCLLVLFSSF